jgi:predicted Zn-dependent protease
MWLKLGSPAASRKLSSHPLLCYQRLMWLAVVLAVSSSSTLATDSMAEALAVEQAGDGPRALQSLDRMVAQKPSSEIARIEAARLRLKLGQELDRAEADLEAARSLAPENPRVHYLWGLLMEERRRGPEAIRSLELAVLYRPEYQDARFRLAGAYFAASDWAKAELHYGALAQLRPDWIQARVQLAAAQEKQQKLAEAERELRQLLAEQPGSPLVRLKMADFYARTDRPQLAAKLLKDSKRKMRELNPSKR